MAAAVPVGSSGAVAVPTRRSSAVCRLDWNDGEVSWTLQRFRAVESGRTETIRRVAGRCCTSSVRRPNVNGMSSSGPAILFFMKKAVAKTPLPKVTYE